MMHEIAFVTRVATHRASATRSDARLESEFRLRQRDFVGVECQLTARAWVRARVEPQTTAAFGSPTRLWSHFRTRGPTGLAVDRGRPLQLEAMLRAQVGSIRRHGRRDQQLPDSGVLGPQDFDFELPPEQIAQRPAARRTAARLMLVPAAGPLEHHGVAALEQLLARERERPLVVVNDSRVVPARVHARRVEQGRAGRRFELLIVDPAPLGPGARVRAWIRGAKKLRPGDTLALEGAPLSLRYLGRDPGGRACELEIVEGQLLAALDAVGELPLPPYIARPQGPSAADLERYQTVYARDRGSVAAPTAGLHFDRELLARLDHVALTLHVGPGTFTPMTADDVREHQVGTERYLITEQAAARIEAARAEGRPILAVGTTVTRTLESVAAHSGGRIVAGAGHTDLVITPGHRFAVVDRLLTNFHLPRSSLLMLVCSFGGRERMLAAYAEAVRAGYRFYSYGDCMLVGGP